MATFATRLSSGAPTFVPRSHLAPTYPEPTTASATVTTNNNNTINNNNNTITTTTTTCQQDSDCGSSSGLGGMKTQEMASDEGGSSSSEPQPASFYPRPTTFPSTMPCYPTMPINPNLPNWLHPTPPGAPNDLFVHVQVGETLSIIVGSEVQHITGPATVRMVGESGVSPSALPIHVPPGHMVHQIVDDQGILRHLILSPETPPRYPNVQTPNSGIASRLSTPHAPNHFHQPPLYTVNRKWSHHSGGSHKMNIQDHVGPTVAAHVARDDEAEMDIDSEEYERVREMLSRILAPQIVRVTPTEADIAWQEIDTSEASAPGGPFPQIDASEYSYQIVLFENQGRFVNSYRCESSGTHLRLCHLRPNTDYYVQLKASLEERGLTGEPSQPVFFKTHPGRPDSPLIPKFVNAGSDWLTISWRSPNDNGANIQVYTVYVTHQNDSNNEKVWEGRGCEAKINNLKPSKSYRLQVTATNRIGESGLSPCLVASTRPDHSQPPSQPAAPNVTTVSTRAVRLTWPSQGDVQYSVEMNDVLQGVLSTVRERNSACWATIQDLQPSSEYCFRLQTHSAEGDSQKSEWVYVKTHGKSERSTTNDRVVVPSKPYILMKTKRKLEIGWRVSSAKEREFTYHLEGSSFNSPNKFRTLYKGPQTSCMITEEDVQNFRVQTVNKKGVASDFSDSFSLPKVEDDLIQKPPQLSAPKLEGAGVGTIAITWKAPQLSLPSTTTLIYEVRRVDSNNEIIYSGKETTCSVEGLASRVHVEVQVRAVIISSSNVRLEGDWSTSGAMLSPRPPPRAPKELRLSADKSYVSWTAVDSCADTRFHIYFCEIVDAKPINEKKYEVNECKYTLTMLGYSRNYSCRVIAYHDGGESLPSEEMYFTTLAGVPSQPDIAGVSIEAESTSILILRWLPPDARGDPIQQYHIRVESRGEVVRDSCVLANPAQTHCEHRLCDLQPDTPYRVEIAAQNGVGTGLSVAISGRTRCLPPNPPTLEAECESSSLRLKWKPQNTHSFLTYRIVRLSDSDHQSTVYDGDQCSFKVRGLQENSEYRFQIRSSDRQNGAGPWSEVYAFRTSYAAPPAMKSPLVATNAGSGCYQLEWTPIIHKPNIRRLFYRLQALDCSLDNAKWHTVYEGMMTSYTLKVSDYPSAVQARVLCVRPEGETGEIVGSPSSVVYMANQIIEKKASYKHRYEVETTEEDHQPSWWHLRADRGITSIAVMTFIVFSLVVAIFVDTLFNLSTPSPPLPSSIGGAAHTISNAPREL
ncbi:unnamed protein product [Auanema sp. JU1783]|nr:unnamed protein product [Auanema sp. JU1783]